MNATEFDNLTIGQAKRLAAMFSPAEPVSVSANHAPRPVIVCTDKRGVVFGYCENIDARPITLTNARMCLYWDKSVGGVFGLAENGPSSASNISATLGAITLEGVTAVMSVDSAAEKAWVAAKVAGR